MIFLFAGANGQSIDKLMVEYNNSTDSVERGDLEHKLARAYQQQRTYSRAIEFYKKVLQNKAADTLLIQQVRANMIFCYSELGDRPAEIAIRESILWSSRLSKSQFTENLQALSALYVATGQYVKARECNELLLQEATHQRDYVLMTKAYNNLGYLFKIQKDQKQSSDYFQKSYVLATTQTGLRNEERTTIITNLGVVSATVGDLDNAVKYFNEALTVARLENVPVKVARAINYKATGYYLRGEYKQSIGILDEALNMIPRLPATEEADAVRSDCFKLMTELMLKTENMTAFKTYQKKYNELQEQALKREKTRNQLLIERQLEIEQQEQNIQRIISENQKDKVKLIQSELAALQQQKELDEKLNELARLTSENTLQESRLKNEALERERISQLLKITQQKADAFEQQQQIDKLNHEKKLQEVSLKKSQEELALMEEAQQQHSKVRRYGFIIIALLLATTGAFIFLYVFRHRKNKVLAEQNVLITSMNNEMAASNEELIAMNDSLHERTREVENQNEKLVEAQQIIHEQNAKLLSYSKNLEAEINKRVKEIRDTNNELVRHNNQLEQFAFTVSHNLRAPIARLLGLTELLKVINDADKEEVLEKIDRSSKDLDVIIHDLTRILDIKSGIQRSLEPVDLKEQINKILMRLENVIQGSGASIEVNLTEVSTIRSVSTYIDSVLYNLVNNAIKYTTPNSKNTIYISTAIRNDAVEISVKDSGIGIALDKYGDQLFGLYKRFNTHTEGKGLGLYLVKTQIESLNGRIEVESSLGKGTTFKVLLPLDVLLVFDDKQMKAVEP